MIDELPVACLVHAIPIIGASNAEDRRQLVASFLDASNPAVRSVAADTLAVMR